MKILVVGTRNDISEAFFARVSGFTSCSAVFTDATVYIVSAL